MKTVRIVASPTSNTVRLTGFDFGDYVRVSSNNNGFDEIRRPVLGRTIDFAGIPSGTYKFERISNGEVAASEIVRIDSKVNQTIDMGDKEFVVRQARPLAKPIMQPEPFPAIELAFLGAAMFGAAALAFKMVK